MALPEDLDRFVSEFGSWDKLAERCDSAGELTDAEKADARHAISFLAKEFGETFFSDGLRAGHGFPVFFLNTAPWTFKWLTEFATSLRRASDCENYDSLRNRLVREDTYGEGLSVLETASRFLEVGFTVQFDPKVRVLEKDKKPDLSLRDPESGDTLYVEVTVLHESKESVDASKSMHAVTSCFRAGPTTLDWTGRLHKSLAEPHLKEITDRVHQICDEARATGKMRALVEPEVIEVAVALPEDLTTLAAWAEEHKLKVNEFHAPGYRDDTTRIRHTIRNEEKQLAREHAGIIVIRTGLPTGVLDDVREAVNELEECVYDYPHLLCVAITGEILSGGPAETHRKGEHELLVRRRLDMLTSEHLILWNRFCSIKPSPAAADKVRRAFRIR